ncbi:helicase-associated domain-containing protein [Paenibacillus sp. AK121]|uniref:helicase-associated domain-containing protein n=1 Tax=Paenibacillus TaxID=44249 RepID=UPI001C22AA98|nr:helicase-associated domain-containing protein [Paenibacillus sp. AK121]MBU9706946.1 helicase-associated domain-containing protein [Paenibacillus sp. AK121]MEE4567249.1 helicase-associated domain-containing protein [Paenibacillus polymyxa]
MDVTSTQGNWNELSADELLVLRRCFVRYAAQPMKEEEPMQLTQGALSGVETKLALHGLRSRGWLEAVTKSWGERILYIPVDRLPALHDMLLEQTPINRIHTDHPITVHEAMTGLESELLHVLSRIAIQGVPLTAKGTIHKRSLQKLNELTPFRPEDLEGLGLHYAHAELYPVQTVVMVDLLLSLGLLVKETVSFRIQEAELATWIRLSAGQMRKHIFDALMERYGKAEAPMQHFRYMLCAVSQYGGTDEWISIQYLLQWMLQVGLIPQNSLSRDDSTNSAFIDIVPTITNLKGLADETVSDFNFNGSFTEDIMGWLKALTAFGMGDWGQTTSGEICFRWNVSVTDLLRPYHDEDTHQEQGAFYVQPDFEILVPPDVAYDVRWRLECCCERVTGDRMVVYRITRESITEAIELGMEAKEIPALLDKYSRTGVPEHVRLAVEQWAGNVGRTAFATVTLLRCGTQEDADMVARHPALEGLLERLGDKDFMIPVHSADKIRKALAAIGLSPRLEPKNADEPAHHYPLLTETENLDAGRSLFSQEGRAGLVYTGRTLHFYEQEHTLPDPSGYFPERSTVPSSWTKEWRSYHTSTSRQLMEQAIRWQAAVGLRISGKEVKWIPESVVSGDPWSVTGWYASGMDEETPSRATLQPSDWSDMRLLVPFT